MSSLYVMGICGLKNEWEKNENNGVGQRNLKNNVMENVELPKIIEQVKTKISNNNNNNNNNNNGDDDDDGDDNNAGYNNDNDKYNNRSKDYHNDNEQPGF